MPEHVYYAALLERCGCSFEELVSTHTEGQIAMLSSGIAMWERKKAEAYNSEGGSKGKRKPKPPKFKSIDEYNSWLASQGSAL